jgi:hypothetical protein
MEKAFTRARPHRDSNRRQHEDGCISTGVENVMVDRPVITYDHFE